MNVGILWLSRLIPNSDSLCRTFENVHLCSKRCHIIYVDRGEWMGGGDTGTWSAAGLALIGILSFTRTWAGLVSKSRC